MRPKKTILLAMADENELSVTKFMLETHRYHVLDVQTGIEAIAAFEAAAVDLVLAEFELPEMNGKHLIELLKNISPYVPMIILGDPEAMRVGMWVADALVAKKTCTAEELLDRIKVMTARKRGPKKGCASYPRVPVIA